MVKKIKAGRIAFQLAATLLLASASGLKLKAQLGIPVRLDMESVPVTRVLEGSIYAAWISPLNDSNDLVHVAKYDGRTWYNLPSFRILKGGQVHDLALYKGRLYAAGGFIMTADRRNTCLAMLNGRIWSGLAAFSHQQPELPAVHSLAVFEDKLFAGGRFTQIASTEITHLAAYNGTSFTRAVNTAAGTDGPVTKLLVTGTDLWINGPFRRFAGQSLNGLASIKNNNLTARNSGLLFAKNIFSAGGTVFAFGIDSNQNRTLMRLNGKPEAMRKGLDSLGDITALSEWKGGLLALGRFHVGGTYNSAFFTMGQWFPDELSPRQNLFNRVHRLRDELILSGPSIWIDGRNRGPGIVRMLADRIRVSGRVFYDKNSNGRWDQGELLLRDRLVQAGSGLSVNTGITGRYDLILAGGRNYTLTLDSRPGWLDAAPQVVQVRDSIRFYEVNFALQPSSSQWRDLSVRIVPSQGTRARLDTAESYAVIVENRGILSTGGSLNLHFNSKVANTVVTPAPDVINNGRFTWNLANLQPGEERRILLHTRFPSNRFNTNEHVSFTASMSLDEGGDGAPDDNRDSLPQTLGYGPAAGVEKLQIPAADAGDSLAYVGTGEQDIHYIIRFENTGTDTARTITIIDTVDISLQIAYIQETGSSHTFVREMQLDPNLPGKAVFVYTFDNINLPPSTGNPEYTLSRGFFGFRIGLKPGNPSGTIIRNRAGVYFDYDAPILTNTVSCMLQEAMQTAQTATGGFHLYPNPANDKIHIAVPDNGLHWEAQVFETGGRKQNLSITQQGTVLHVDAGTLSAGTYFITLRQGATHKIIPFIVQH
jgi:uncharacterized repeat protein (TIGR01451 family)